ncbi:MAG: T9SS type A sorting domain-containing protein, partial [Saprospiraceae bacterium]|nr:T9SS type A sorting domain-containing protein [Saprospiraceae bacterium]
DSLGMACQFEQNAVMLPAVSSAKFPNMVNYRLGALDPPCSVTTGEALPAASVRAYPNPANGQFTLEWGAALPGAKRLLWYDATGRCIGEAGVEAGAASHTLSTRHWPPGLYFWSLRSEQGRNVAAGRVVVE